mmetsp:Transcript_28210/g.100185  ORF Transcript_28210/g.100185 Transcript_28210/m.100185 type:complete len:231 (+) Transcript_28210:1186-1878(+)
MDRNSSVVLSSLCPRLRGAPRQRCIRRARGRVRLRRAQRRTRRRRNRIDPKRRRRGRGRGRQGAVEAPHWPGQPVTVRASPLAVPVQLARAAQPRCGRRLCRAALRGRCRAALRGRARRGAFAARRGAGAFVARRGAAVARLDCARPRGGERALHLFGHGHPPGRKGQPARDRGPKIRLPQRPRQDYGLGQAPRRRGVYVWLAHGARARLGPRSQDAVPRAGRLVGGAAG